MLCAERDLWSLSRLTFLLWTKTPSSYCSRLRPACSRRTMKAIHNHVLQQIHIFLVLQIPEADVALQVESHGSEVEGQNPVPSLAAHSPFDAAQDTACFPHWCHKFPGHIKFSSIVFPSPPSQGCSKPVCGLCWYRGLLQPRCKAWVHNGSLSKPVKIPLAVILSLKSVNSVFHLWLIYK